MPDPQIARIRDTILAEASGNLDLALWRAAERLFIEYNHGERLERGVSWAFLRKAPPDPDPKPIDVPATPACIDDWIETGKEA